MNKVTSSVIAIAVASATVGAFAQPGTTSTETKVERSTTVQPPYDGVKVEEKKTTTSTSRPAANPESKSKTTTTTSKRKDEGDTVVKSKTKTETETKY
jgi:hypothetical protein